MKICRRGHEQDYYVSPNGSYYCRPCRNILQNEWRKQKMKENPRWRLEQKYKHEFGGIRDDVLQRDGEKCVSCGMTRQQHKEKYNLDITVDHIDGKGKGLPAKEKNNALENLQTLCLACHGKKDVARRKTVGNRFGRGFIATPTKNKVDK